MKSAIGIFLSFSKNGVKSKQNCTVEIFNEFDKKIPYTFRFLSTKILSESK